MSRIVLTTEPRTSRQCYEKIGYRTIRGPWRLEFEVPNPAVGDRPEREADD